MKYDVETWYDPETDMIKLKIRTDTPEGKKGLIIEHSTESLELKPMYEGAHYPRTIGNVYKPEPRRGPMYSQTRALQARNSTNGPPPSGMIPIRRVSLGKP